MRCLSFLGDTLLSGSTDGTVRLWDFNSLLAHPAADLNGPTGGTAEPADVEPYGGGEPPATPYGDDDEADVWGGAAGAAGGAHKADDDHIDSPPAGYVPEGGAGGASPEYGDNFDADDE